MKIHDIPKDDYGLLVDIYEKYRIEPFYARDLVEDKKDSQKMSYRLKRMLNAGALELNKILIDGKWTKGYPNKYRVSQEGINMVSRIKKMGYLDDEG